MLHTALSLFMHEPTAQIDSDADWDEKLQARLGMNAAQLYQGIMRLLARQRSSERDDLAHDIFLSVLLHLDQYRGDGPAQAWVATIARHQTTRWATRHRRQVVGLGDWSTQHDPSASPEQQLQERQFMSMVHQALEQHTTTTRQALLLTELEGQSCQEAAQVLGLDEQRVKNRKSDARKQLRDDPALLEALPSHWGSFARLGAAAIGAFLLVGALLWWIGARDRQPTPTQEAIATSPTPSPQPQEQGASKAPTMIASPAAQSSSERVEALYKQGLYTQAQQLCQSEASKDPLCELIDIELAARNPPLQSAQCATLDRWSKDARFTHALRARTLWRNHCVSQLKSPPTPTPQPALSQDASLEERKRRANSLLFAGGDTKEAINLCTQVLNEGGSKDCYRILGIAYHKQGDKPNACKNLNLALKSNPPNPQAIEGFMKKLGCKKTR